MMMEMILAEDTTAARPAASTTTAPRSDEPDTEPMTGGYGGGMMGGGMMGGGMMGGGMMGGGMGSYSDLIRGGGYPGEPNETQEEAPNGRD